MSHGLAARLWSNNEQDINTLESYEFELCTLCLHLNFKYFNLDLKDINT
jgi:hypothetical protein